MTIFTVERIAHYKIKVFFNNMSSRWTTSAALLLLMKLEGFTKGSSELTKGVLSRRTLGDGLVGPFDINDRISEEP